MFRIVRLQRSLQSVCWVVLFCSKRRSWERLDRMAVVHGLGDVVIFWYHFHEETFLTLSICGRRETMRQVESGGARSYCWHPVHAVSGAEDPAFGDACLWRLAGSLPWEWQHGVKSVFVNEWIEVSNCFLMRM